MPSYVLPQVLVYQEFVQQPAALDEPLRACILGEQFALHRYNVAGEKAGCRLKTTTGANVVYDPNDDYCYSWPGRNAGEVPDDGYTRVFFDNALLQYFHDPIGSGSPIYWVAPGKNRIRADSIVWKTGNGYTRDAALLRDVKAGDIIHLMTNACGSLVELDSIVTGLIADIVPAVTDAAEVEDSNQDATILAGTSAQTGGTVNNVVISVVSAAAYDGLDEGYPSEIYDVEVIAGSVGGDATTAILRVTSASGEDSQDAIIPSAFGVATDIGVRGATITFTNTGDDFLVGQVWRVEVSQAYTPSVPASAGTYIGTTDMTYIVEVTRGGAMAGVTKPLITVTTNTGQDVSGPTEITASATPADVGNLGVTIQFTGTSLCKGDRFYIPVVAASAGAIRTLSLANNLPDAMRGICLVGSSSSSSSGATPDLDVTLYIKSNIEVPEDRTGSAPLVNWTQSDTEICLNQGITAFDAEWVNALGELVALPVVEGDPYITWRGRVPTWCNTVGTVSQASGVPAVLGTVDPDNPLAFGVYKALTNSNGEEVKFLAICSSSPVTLDDWLRALDLLVGRDDVYSIVPLSQEKTVLDAVLAHVLAESTPENGRWRIAWLNLALLETIGVYTATDAGGAVLGTVTDDPDTAGSQYTLVEITGGKLSTQGVRAGDILRTSYTTDGFGNVTYSEYVVDTVVNEETCRLMAGPAVPIPVAQKMEFWRNLSRTEMGTQLAANPGLFGSRRAYLVWPDVVGNAGVTFPGYFLCAGLAGLRSGVLPHQGLTNVELLGFDDLSRTVDLFSATQLNAMSASGYWIVTRDPNDGTVYTRHQLSCGDQSDVNQKEQSITTNVDHISFTLLDRMKPYIGRGNVTESMINTIHGELLSLLDEFRNTVINPNLGPQLNAYEITELAQHATYKDRIVARVSIVPPAPFNNLEAHLIIS